MDPATRDVTATLPQSDGSQLVYRVLPYPNKEGPLVG